MKATYREYAPPASLRPMIACLWEHVPRRDGPHRIVPDGCVDLIWLGGRGRLVVAGADTSAREVELPGGVSSAGVRLRPGAAGAVLGLSAAEVRDREVPASLLWGTEAERLADELAAAAPPSRPELLARVVEGRDAVPDPLVGMAAARLGRGASVSTVADELGISERQLHRRTLAAVGYGPKMLARVARLRRLVDSGDGPLARRALEAGYASQAHMNEDVRRLTGTTPVRFLKDAVPMAA